jgi:signal transduction histidine kinase
LNELITKLSIKAKIILATTIVLGVIYSLFSLTFYQRVKIAYIGRLDARLESYVEKMREEVEEQYLERKFPSLPDLRNLRVEGLPNPSVRLFDSIGIVILPDSTLEDWPTKPWSEFAGNEYLFEERKTPHGRLRSVWAPVEANDRNQFAVQVAYPKKEVETSLALLQLLLLIGVPVALVISALSVYAIVSTAFRPLSDVIQAAERVTASNLRERLRLPRTRDEVFRLTSSFNVMMDRLESAFKVQKQFVADASHEIRTPLAIIRSELEYVQRHLSESSSNESLKAALEEVDRLKKLSDDLLLLAKLESSTTNLKSELIRIDEILTECVMRMKPVADRANIHLQFHISEAVELRGDEDELRVGFLNLIDNAIKYSHGGGIVAVTLSLSGRSVIVDIRDDGEGISVEDLPNIFKRFHRTEFSRSRQDGSGLGLAIVHRIVELHKGTLSVQSQPGKGSTFTVTLPK